MDVCFQLVFHEVVPMKWSVSPRRAGAGLLFTAWLAFGSSTALAVTPFDPVTITFDEIGVPGNPLITELDVGEYRFSSIGFHTIANPGGGSLPLVQNGSFFISEDGGEGEGPITIARLDGFPFALLELDGAEAFLSDVEATLAGFPNAATLEITAQVFGGGTANISLPLDGIKDGLGGAADFQPFTLPAAFCGITSATIWGRTASGADGAIALDNVRVAAVIPEPATVVFAIVALAVACAWRKKRRSPCGAG
jgi:hypothetical protein